jgi:probable tail fiber protein|nr:MAG TPA: Tail fiber protein [Caudoviricetes sp.]
MASLITPQFEQYIAQQTINKGTVVFDEFVFANIPGLTAENLKNHLTMPQAAHIVHRQAISQSGVVNENAVVYSVTIGTEVGDFDFNFIGLVNKSKNMLAVAIQTTPVKKVRNKNAVQGNSITRNVLLEFRGAKALTNINVTAQTWQIDFTVRLHGIDEKIRLTNRDLYGRAVFFDDSFLVKRKSGNDYTIEPGVAYVEGMRANMTALENINAANLPCSIYLDVVHHCTVTGAYETEIKFLKANKADYTDTTNRPHYVQILADIDRNGVVTDRRLLSPFLGINPLDLDDTTPNKADKRGHTHRLPLASLIKRGIVKLYSGYNSDAEDLAATPKAIKTLKAFIDAITRNLGNYIPNSKKSSRVDSNSADDVATSAAVKSANDNANNRVPKTGDTTINGTLRAKNTSGGWSAYQFETSQGYWQVEVHPESHEEANRRFNMFFQPNIGKRVYLSFPALGNNGETVAYQSFVVNKAGDTMTGQLTVPKIHLTENNTGESLKLGDDAWLGDVNVGNAVGVKGQQNPEQGYIAYGSDKKRFGFDGNMFFSDSALATNQIGHGSYAQQYNVAAPFYVHETLSAARDTYHPFIKGRVRAAGQYGAAFSLGYTTNQRQGGDGYGTGVIHLISDAGDNRLWQFGHNGEFVSAGDVITSAGRSLNSAIYREGNPHDIALSWQRDGFKVRVDNVDIGRVAFKLDLPRERLIWQGATDNPITVNVQVSKGLLCILMDTPHGAQANRPIWFSSPIEHCHDTKIGDFNTGGTAGDYNFNTLALLSRNGTNITITPLNDGRKPRIQKVVVFG